MLVDRKVAFNWMPAIWGDGGLSVPQKHLRRLCLAMKDLKGKGEVISVYHWDGGQSHCHPPLCAGLCAGLLTSCYFSLDALLFTQFVHTVGKITEGKAREEIWSSVSYLFFTSTSFICGKNQQVRQGIVWPKDLKGVLSGRWVECRGA